MTDDMRTNTVEETAPKTTMGEVSHANPYTGGTFGAELAFERGPAVAADGGERNAVSRTSSDRTSDGGRGDAEDESGEEETMEDVDHEHPHDDADEANRVFARGHADENEDENGETGPV